MFVEDDDDEYIDLSEVSDEIFRSVDAFSTDDEQDFLNFDNDAEGYNQLANEAAFNFDEK